MRKAVRGVLEPSPSNSSGHSRTTNSSGPSVESSLEDTLQAATSRLNSFSFGAKPQPQPQASSSRQPLLPSLALIASDTKPKSLPLPTPTLTQDNAMLTAPLSRPPSLLLTAATPLSEDPPQPTTPPRSRKRHSHTRSTSISIPSSRPQSLAAFPISPGLSPGSAASSPRKLTFGPSGRGAEAEKERARASAFASLEGSRQPRVDIVSLPQFDDDEPPPMSFGLPKPFAWTDPAPSAPEPEVDMPVPKWGADATEDAGLPEFTLPVGALGSVAEEEEDEDDLKNETKTTPGLKELHLLSTTPTSAPRPDQAAEVEPAQTPTKGYGTIGRGRPRPLSGIGIATSPSTPSVATPTSARRRGGSKSSISYVRDGSSSSGDGSRDLGRIVISPSSVPMASSTPSFSARSNRPCPRPRSLINLGRGSGRVLGEVDEVSEEGSPLKRDSMATETSYDSFDLDSGLHRQLRDAEMDREALKEDIEDWRHRCKTLEDRLDAEKREAMVLRDRVRKRELSTWPPLTPVGDRLSSVSSTHSVDDKPSSRSEADAFAKAQGRLLTQMRDQLFSLAAALDAERGAKNDALAALHEAHLERDAEREVWRQEREAWLSRETTKRLSRVTTNSSNYSLSSVASSYAPPVRVVSGGTDYPLDPEEWSKRGLVALKEEEEDDDHRASFTSTESSIPVATPNPDQSASRMKIWGFPRGAVARSPQRKDSIYDSFFTLPAEVEPAQDVGFGVGVELPPIPSPMLPPKANVFTPARSTSLTMPASATTSALSFLAGYLPSVRTPSPEVPKSLEPEHDSFLSGSFGSQSSSLLRKSSTARTKRFISASAQPVPLPSPIGQLDFTGGCRHCANDVFDL